MVKTEPFYEIQLYPKNKTIIPASPDRSGNPFCLVFFDETKRLKRRAGTI